MPPPALETKDLRKRFGDRWVVGGISAAVAPGTGLALIGPSGAGKTTFLRLIAGIEAPDAGEVHLHGWPATADGVFLPPEARGLAMVFQDFALWPHMSVARHLDFVLRGRGLCRRTRRNRIEAMLELVGLGDKRDAAPAQLSGGEAQRVAIARALVTEPPLLLLDEPFSNLDSATRSGIVDELARRKREDGVALVLASHDAADSASLCEQTLAFTK